MDEGLITVMGFEEVVTPNTPAVVTPFLLSMTINAQEATTGLGFRNCGIRFLAMSGLRLLVCGVQRFREQQCAELYGAGCRENYRHTLDRNP